MNYNLAAFFCREISIREEVCIVIKSGIRYKVFDCKAMYTEFVSEFCCIELIDYNIVIVILYGSCQGHRQPTAQGDKLIWIMRKV